MLSQTLSFQWTPPLPTKNSIGRLSILAPTSPYSSTTIGSMLMPLSFLQTSTTTKTSESSFTRIARRAEHFSPNPIKYRLCPTANRFHSPMVVNSTSCPNSLCVWLHFVRTLPLRPLRSRCHFHSYLCLSGERFRLPLPSERASP